MTKRSRRRENCSFPWHLYIRFEEIDRSIIKVSDYLNRQAEFYTNLEDEAVRKAAKYFLSPYIRSRTKIIPPCKKFKCSTCPFHLTNGNHRFCYEFFENCTYTECRYYQVGVKNNCILQVSNKKHTLKEIAEVFGITRERVRQIENMALAKIKLFQEISRKIEEEEEGDAYREKVGIENNQPFYTGIFSMGSKIITEEKRIQDILR